MCYSILHHIANLYIRKIQCITVFSNKGIYTMVKYLGITLHNASFTLEKVSRTLYHFSIYTGFVSFFNCLGS